MNYYRIIFSIMAAVSFLFAACDDGFGFQTLFEFEREENTEDPSLAEIASILPTPVRREYFLEGDAIAKTEDHLRVFAVYNNGTTRNILLKDTIVLMEDQELIEEPSGFTSSGEKTLTVQYAKQSAQYIIIVRSSTDPPTGTGSGTDTPGTGSETPSTDNTSIAIEIKWR